MSRNPRAGSTRCSSTSHSTTSRNDPSARPCSSIVVVRTSSPRARARFDAHVDGSIPMPSQPRARAAARNDPVQQPRSTMRPGASVARCRRARAGPSRPGRPLLAVRSGPRCRRRPRPAPRPPAVARATHARSRGTRRASGRRAELVAARTQILARDLLHRPVGITLLRPGARADGARPAHAGGSLTTGWAWIASAAS